jgi:hypothetical protein
MKPRFLRVWHEMTMDGDEETNLELLKSLEQLAGKIRHPEERVFVLKHVARKKVLEAIESVKHREDLKKKHEKEERRRKTLRHTKVEPDEE